MSFCWSHCIRRQKATDKERRCPLTSHGATLDIRSVYSAFLQNASQVLALDALPTNLSLPLDISVDVLVDKEASWHKSCDFQFSTSKLNKAKERSALERKPDQQQEQAQENEEVRPSKTRRSTCHNKEHCTYIAWGGRRCGHAENTPMKSLHALLIRT